MRAILILFVLIGAAFGADLQLYVDTASTTGGTCLSNATTGTDRACISLSAAWGKIPADMSATGNVFIDVAASSAHPADTTFPNFSGKTMGTNWVHVRPASGQEHRGIWDTSKYRLDVNGATGAFALGNPNVWLDGIQFRTNKVNGLSHGLYTIAGAGTFKISNCLIIGNFTGTDVTGTYLAVSVTVPTTYYLWNNIFYGWNKSGTSAEIDIVSCSTSQTCNWYNNTAVEVGKYGLRRAAGTVVAKNNLVTGSGTADYFGTSTGWTSVNNISSDATSPNAGGTDCGGHSCRSQTIQYVNAISLDYHLSGSDTAAKGAGADLSGEFFTTDIDGTTRGTPWDVGADQAAAPALSASCMSITTGVAGAAYGPSSIVAANGTPPYTTYVVSSGALPTGLVIDAATGAISGTPSAAAAYTFVVTVTDSALGTANTPSCGITISAPLVGAKSRWSIK